MDDFQNLFGISKDSVQPACVICPFIPKGVNEVWGVQEFSRGKLYSTAQAQNFTLIHSRMGSLFTGDAVLYLKDTPAKNLIFLGSCGLVKRKEDLSLGSLLVVEKCLEMESFSRLVNNQYNQPDTCGPDAGLLEKTDKRIPRAVCATLGSIYCESQYYDWLLKENIDAVEMEISSFYNAAKHADKKAVAFCYATDILKELSPFTEQSAELKAQIEHSVKLICRIIQNYIADIITP